MTVPAVMETWMNMTTVQTFDAIEELLDKREGLVSLHSLTIVYYYVMFPVRTLVIVLGIITNGLCLRAFYRTGVEDSVTVILFVQNILDFLTVVFHLTYPVMSVCILLERWLDIRLPFVPMAVMVLEAEIKSLFFLPNCTNTTFLAVQRCLCVAMPLQFKGLFTRRRTIFILASIFIFHAIFYLALLAHYQMKWTEMPPHNLSRLVLIFKPNKRFWANITYFLFHIVLNTANQIIVTVCVIYMAHVLIRSVRFRVKSSSSTSGGRHQEEYDCSHPSKESSGSSSAVAKTSVLKDTKELIVIKQVALVCTIYMVCNIPRFCYYFAKLIEPEFDINRRYENLLGICYSIKMAFEILNSSLNFFVYYKYNDRFRKACFGAVKKNT